MIQIRIGSDAKIIHTTFIPSDNMSTVTNEFYNNKLT
jgi:hypothetical protein